MREAKHSYALDNGDTDVMRDMVGKQVRVNGTIKDTSDLHKEAAKTNTDDRRLDIDAGDLAKIDVQGIVQVAEACGQKQKKGWSTSLQPCSFGGGPKRSAQPYSC